MTKDLGVGHQWTMEQFVFRARGFQNARIRRHVQHPRTLADHSEVFRRDALRRFLEVTG